ncbi:hypothetical protein BHE74_00022998 [Ensete ventricosum]|nr:hypothetical protein BHE74_00022998 [Ensete ventricosum]
MGRLPHFRGSLDRGSTAAPDPRVARHRAAMAEESKSGVGAAEQAATSPKIVLKSIDMSEKMRNDAIDCARAVRLLRSRAPCLRFIDPLRTLLTDLWFVP